MALRYYQKMRRESIKRKSNTGVKMLSKMQVESILKRCHHASVLSGATHKLCLYAPPGTPAESLMDPQQLVIITSGESQSLAHSKDAQERYHLQQQHNKE